MDFLAKSLGLDINALAVKLAMEDETLQFLQLKIKIKEIHKTLWLVLPPAHLEVQ